MKDLKMRNLSGLAGFTVMRGAALVCVLSLVSMLGVIFWNAMPAMTWEFFTEAPRNMMSEGGIWPCIVGTFLLAAGALVIALPLGVMSAVFLNEYNLDSPVITVIRLSIANLAGVPSIIFGLFGLTFFVVFDRMLRLIYANIQRTQTVKMHHLLPHHAKSPELACCSINHLVELVIQIYGAVSVSDFISQLELGNVVFHL